MLLRRHPERVKVVRTKAGVVVDGPAAGNKGAKSGGGGGKAKGKGKTKATPEPETQLPATSNEPAAAPGSEVSAPAPERESVTPKKAGRQKKASGEKKLSALDAAVKVLTETGASVNCQELIQVMAEKDYWTSPGRLRPLFTPQFSESSNQMQPSTLSENGARQICGQQSVSARVGAFCRSWGGVYAHANNATWATVGALGASCG